MEIMRSSYYQDLDLTVFEWFKQNRSLKIRINRPIFFKKAEHFAILHGHINFKPSNGFIDRCKKRYSSSFVTMNRVSGKSDSESAYNWLIFLKTLITCYEPSDIFNASETWHFYKCNKISILFKKKLVYKGFFVHSSSLKVGSTVMNKQ